MSDYHSSTLGPRTAVAGKTNPSLLFIGYRTVDRVGRENILHYCSLTMGLGTTVAGKTNTLLLFINYGTADCSGREN